MLLTILNELKNEENFERPNIIKEKQGLKYCLYNTTGVLDSQKYSITMCKFFSYKNLGQAGLMQTNIFLHTK